MSAPTLLLDPVQDNTLEPDSPDPLLPATQTKSCYYDMQDVKQENCLKSFLLANKCN